MRILEVPVFDDNNEIKATLVLQPEEAHHLLQFALNFLVSAGLATSYQIKEDENVPSLEEMDFDPTKPN